MPYSFEIKPGLVEKLKKIKKKNVLLFQRIQKKIAEIVEDPTHYKPLRYDMKNIRRVHFDPFVLIFSVNPIFIFIIVATAFSVNETEKLIEFLEFDHHDNVYKR